MKSNLDGFAIALSRAIGIITLVAMLGAALIALAAEAKQKTFATPEDAAKALVAATKSGDLKAMLDILGLGSKGIVQSGDAVADRGGRERFVKAYEEANRLEKSGDAKFVLSVGKDNWPLPIPIVKDAAGWRFDTQAAKEEILNRRIGRNELSAIQAVQAFVDAQREYYLRNPQKDKLLHYAQKFISAQGKRGGLYYPTKAGEQASPLGPLFERAKAVGYEKGKDAGKPVPYHGYYYRILTSQGSNAPGGKYSYLINGYMVGGFALLAYPAKYGSSGVMTFLVNQNGAIYQKDLGEDTEKIALGVKEFNPDKTWTKLE